MLRTLTPEIYAYSIAIVAVCGLGSITLSAHLHARWFSQRTEFILVHSVVLSLLVSFFWFLCPLHIELGTTWLHAIWGIFLGGTGAWLALRLDLYIVRLMTRSKPASRQRPSNTEPRVRLRSVSMGLASESTRPRLVGAQKMQEQVEQNSEAIRLRPILLGLVAILEEVIFRGYLLKLCQLLPYPSLGVLAGIGAICVFGMSHVFFGWLQAVAKIALGVIATLVTVLSGGILGAIIVHVLFNIAVWHKTERFRIKSSDSYGRRI